MSNVVKCTSVVKYLYPDVSSHFPTSGVRVSPGGRIFGTPPSLDGTFIPVKFQRISTLLSRRPEFPLSDGSAFAKAENSEPFPDTRAKRRFKESKEETQVFPPGFYGLGLHSTCAQQGATSTTGTLS